jgi:7-keto-8-aminopelargonate synthetase-like enzyme
MGAFSKAIPSCGGYVAASAPIIDAVKHRGRGFIYSAALPPAQAAAALAALNVMRDETWRVAGLQRNIAIFAARLRAQGVSVSCAGTPIFPVICGDDEKAFAVAKTCQDGGVFVQAIPSPVVPAGTARLRCCVTALHREQDLEQCARVIAAACRKHRAVAVVPRRTGILTGDDTDV